MQQQQQPHSPAQQGQWVWGSDEWVVLCAYVCVCVHCHGLTFWLYSISGSSVELGVRETESMCELAKQFCAHLLQVAACTGAARKAICVASAEECTSVFGYDPGACLVHGIGFVWFEARVHACVCT